jgi:NAD+-dependent protein deacetylase sirtuin 4
MQAAERAASVAAVTEMLRGRRLVVLAGAGCSTESGIPDYRGPGATARKRPPVQYQEFVRDPHARVRYWSRSLVGWPRFSAARPNAAHAALARLEQGGVAVGVITQNVDGLHQAAGSRSVVELHGALSQVRCLACDVVTSRHSWQQRLVATNAAWVERLNGSAAAAPDGDAELDAAAMSGFIVPDCEACGGVVKPDVVFFGENVPKPRVEEAWRVYDEGDVLLVVGSSLTVYSGRRFIYRAQQDQKPIVVVNMGPTRADEAAAAKVDGPLGTVLPQVAEALLGAVR